MQGATAIMFFLLVFGVAIVSVVLAKGFQLASMKDAIQNAWFYDRHCTSDPDSCKIRERDHLGRPPDYLGGGNYDVAIANLSLDYVARISRAGRHRYQRYPIVSPPLHRTVKLFNPPDSDSSPTFGIAWDHPDSPNTLVFAFRATTTGPEIRDDMETWQVRWSDGQMPVEMEDLLPDSSVGMVHHGFYDRYVIYREAFLDTVKEHGCTDVLVTGHSLGGAVATLLCYDLGSSTDPRLAKVERVAGYVFGTPRVGNLHFDQAFRNLSKVVQFFRVHNTEDQVADLPTSITPNFKRPKGHLFYYAHTGEAHEFTRNWGSWRTNHFLPLYQAQLLSELEE